MNESSPPFFIVGSGRSGTTLLRLLLSNHSRIFITPETWFIIDLIEHLPLTSVLSPAEVESAVGIIVSDYRWPDMEISTADFRQTVARLDGPMLRDIIQLVYDTIRARMGKARLGDKTPPYIAIVPQLTELFPAAKFIHLIRDGRDVSISFIELEFPSRYYDGRRCEWIAAMEAARSYRQSGAVEHILEIRYENLVKCTEETLRTICGFLGEEFEPEMLERRPQISLVPERERVIHTKLGRTISVDAVAVWRSELSEVECFCMEACLREYLLELGYELRFKHIIWQPLLICVGAILRLSAPFLDRVIPALKRRGIIRRDMYF